MLDFGFDLPQNITAAPCWKIGARSLAPGNIPLLMGIVNVTPDSFSDGGRFLHPEKAIAHGLQLLADGADILDVGGQSTRPGSDPVDENEEWRRLEPVIRGLRERTSTPISVDTYFPSVAEQSLACGAEVINDIRAFRDPAMLRLAVESGCGLCAMHMLGEPKTMQNAPKYEDVTAEVGLFLKERRDFLLSAGVEAARIALDPGIGFGKTTAHNLELLKNVWRYHELGCPLLVGHSRKRFLGEIIGSYEADRLPATIRVSLSLARQKVQILRVHDVGAVRDALVRGA